MREHCTLLLMLRQKLALMYGCKDDSNKKDDQVDVLLRHRYFLSNLVSAMEWMLLTIIHSHFV